MTQKRVLLCGILAHEQPEAIKNCLRGGEGDIRMKRIRQTVERLCRLAEEKLNDINLKKKLFLLYLCCVLFPLIVTDTTVLTLIIRNDRKESEREMTNIADAIAYDMNAITKGTYDMGQRIYSNRYVNEFISKDHGTTLGYYEDYLDFLRDSLYEMAVGKERDAVVIYADNPSIVNGGYFKRLETVENTEWYRTFAESGREYLLLPHFENGSIYGGGQKKLSMIQRMDYYHKGSGGDVIRLDLDYSGMSRSIINARYSDLVYVCCDGKILFSNDGRGGIAMPFETLGSETVKQAGMHKRIEVYGSVWDIYVIDKTSTALRTIQSNLPLFLFLVLLNVLLPYLFVRSLNRSFTLRLRALGRVLEEEDTDSLHPLPEAKGKDEIGTLMRSYNHMAERMNELIQTVYKDKLKEQEMDIARQTAELLALHSQINPHFLFNALESIRMHSILKKEYETADMVEKLALMQRQNVEWSEDEVRVEDEVRFVEAYLELQKYRFGERLSYRVEVEKGCGGRKIPKLSLVTFVENACVHGMENKTAPGWIFVRIYTRPGEMCMEIEDTGSGMEEWQEYELQEKMNHAEIGQLKEKGRVGILNACIRLKMATQGRVFFELESEPGAGTIVTVHMRDGEKEEKDDAEGAAGG